MGDPLLLAWSVPVSLSLVGPCLSITSKATGQEVADLHGTLCLLPAIPRSLAANKEQAAKKKKSAQLEAQGSLLTDHKAWEACWGLTGKHHCFLCWRRSQDYGYIPYYRGSLPIDPSPRLPIQSPAHSKASCTAGTTPRHSDSVGLG